MATPRVALKKTVVPMLALGLLLGVSGRVLAGPLDPNSFTSLGTLGPGTYIIDSGGNLTGGVPTIYDSSLNKLFSGVVSNGIAVFAFSSINLGATSSVDVDSFQVYNPLHPTETLPVALLSQTNETIAGTITVEPTSVGGPGTGQVGGVVSFNQGPIISTVQGGGGGGGFGTAGSPGTTFSLPPPLMSAHGGAGGLVYGDLTQQLQTGSPGGAGANPGGNPNFPVFLLGGGAIELGASGLTTITGSVQANGEGGNLLGLLGAGGGSGGAIYVHGSQVNVVGNPFSVQGGQGAGGGGVGRFSIEAGGNGGAGRVVVQIVPEPPSLVMATLAAFAGLGYAWRAARRAITPS
jgi:hypothetical protein